MSDMMTIAWAGVPVAWAAVAQNGQPLSLAFDRHDAVLGTADVVPLYRSPTLTDEERDLLRRLSPMEDACASVTVKLSPADRRTVFGLLHRIGGIERLRLTDAEREARHWRLEAAVHRSRAAAAVAEIARLRGLLERTK